MFYELFTNIAPYMTLAGIVGSVLFFLGFSALVAVCCIRKAVGKCPAKGCRC